MPCTDCCNQIQTCGYGVGLDPPTGTRNIGALLLNDTILIVNANSFSVNGKHKNASGGQTGDTQIILLGANFYLIGKEGFTLYQITVPNISYVSGRCYFMGLTIQTSPTRQIIATVQDSLGNVGTASRSTAGDTFYVANVKIGDNVNTYVFFRPTWFWDSISGCGVQATFWTNGFVFEGQLAGCTINSTGKKIEYDSSTLKIKIGKNAASYKACNTQLW